MKRVNEQQVRKWLGKKRLTLVSEIGIGKEVCDVLLKSGYKNKGNNQTTWVWSWDYFDCDNETVKDMRDDLHSFFSDVVKIEKGTKEYKENSIYTGNC